MNKKGWGVRIMIGPVEEAQDPFGNFILDFGKAKEQWFMVSGELIREKFIPGCEKALEKFLEGK